MASLRTAGLLVLLLAILACRSAPSDYDLRVDRIKTLISTEKSMSQFQSVLEGLKFEVEVSSGKEYRSHRKLAGDDGPELMWPIVKNESIYRFDWIEEEIPFPGIYSRRIYLTVQSSGDVITKVIEE